MKILNNLSELNTPERYSLKKKEWEKVDAPFPDFASYALMVNDCFKENTHLDSENKGDRLEAYYIVETKIAKLRIDWHDIQKILRACGKEGITSENNPILHKLFHEKALAVWNEINRASSFFNI